MNLINSLHAGQYGLVNFQRFDVNFGGSSIEFVGGKYIAEAEGTGLYVEATDFPILLGFHNQTGNLNSMFALRDGQYFDTPFRGLTISTPGQFASKVGARLILCKNGAKYSNELAAPYARLSVGGRTLTNTAISQVSRIYCPPGARGLAHVMVQLTSATTITGAVINFYDSTGAAINFGTLTVVGGQSYGDQAKPLGLVDAVSLGEAPVIMFSDILFPTQAVECEVVITGTGLAGPVAWSGNYE